MPSSVELAQERSAELICLSEEIFTDRAAFDARLNAMTGGRGFDDIVVIAASTAAVENALPHLADGAVMNVFAGLPRGTQATFDINAIDCPRRALHRHQRLVHRRSAPHARFDRKPGALHQQLGRGRRRSRAACRTVCARWPMVVLRAKSSSIRRSRKLPLTPLEELAELLPSVRAKLKDGQIWTNEAEEELLRVMLND